MRAFLLVAFITMSVPFLSLSCLAANPEHVGIVKTVSGAVTIVRNNVPQQAETNMRLMKGDQIRTGENGKVGLIFEDDTTIAIGPNSSIVIDDFLFKPNEKKLSFIARILQGTVAYLSGQIAKLAPNHVRIETPQATVGMRGTHVLIKVD